MEINMKVIQNFLDIKTFKKIQNTIMGLNEYRQEVAWFYNNTIAHSHEKNNQYYFTHTLYDDYTPKSTYFEKLLVPILEKLEVKSMIRAKINLYPSTHKLIHHATHTDNTFPHKGCVFSINTCDGYTQLGYERIPSIENQALLFDSSKEHNSTSCTDAQARFNININYF